MRKQYGAFSCLQISIITRLFIVVFSLNTLMFQRVVRYLNGQINQINQLIKEDIYHSIVDLHSLFIDERGLMNEKFTTDGVHLNDMSYSVWVDAIRNDILSLNK